MKTGYLTLQGLYPITEGLKALNLPAKSEPLKTSYYNDAIMDLYQENIPSLLSATDNFSMNKQRLFDYVEKNQIRLTDSTTNLYKILASDESQNICTKLKKMINEIIYNYNECINKMNTIISEIDKEYKEE